MCGIAGFYNARVDQKTISSITKSLVHRGPDEQGAYVFGHAGLIHTRLSIIELSPLGSQPYAFDHLRLAYNGELYNYREVRTQLENKGYSFLSDSDTEVVIKAFHCWGENCVDRFIGMFAFAIYNEREDEIVLCRDRVGVKPLYYSYNNGAFLFASELKTLMLFGGSREINPDAVALYFRFGFVPAHLSIFADCNKLEPAHWLKVSAKGLSKHKYWNVKFAGIRQTNEQKVIDDLEGLMVSSFRYRMVSDVPVGVFLSGGIDSSLLVAMLQRHHGGIHSFTIGFKESAFDESVYAAEVASYTNTRHVSKMLGIAEGKEWLTKFYDMYDEPFADTSGIPTSSVTRLAKEYGVKVVLSADGGDELFGGYTHYHKASKLFRKFATMPAPLRHSIAKTLSVAAPPGFRKGFYPFNTEHKLYALEELLEANNPTAFFEAFIANQSIEEVNRMLNVPGVASNGSVGAGAVPVEDMMAWDFNYFLPDDLLTKIDRATMFQGVECREPFLDHRLIEFAATIPDDLKVRDGKGKYLLRKLLSRYLPEKYFERPKKGFSIPLFSWFSEDLDGMLQSHFTSEKLKDVPHLNATEVQHEYRKYLNYKRHGKQYNIEKMWRLLSFIMWWEKYKSL